MLSYSIIKSLELKFNDFFNEMIENLNCQGCQIDKKNIGRQRYFIMRFEIFQVKWDMSVVKLFKKKVIPHLYLYEFFFFFFYDSYILNRILHLASKTMYFGVSFAITPSKYVVVDSLQVIVRTQLFLGKGCVARISKVWGLRTDICLWKRALVNW